MMEVLEQKLQFNYENSSSASYLTVLVDDSIKIKRFQIEMIACNTIKGIVPVDIRNKNNSTWLYYDITSKQALAQYLSRKKLTKAEFAGVLSDMVSVLIKSSAYLLSEKGFLLHEDYIYINPSTGEICFIYLPFDTEENQIYSFRDFVIKMIVKLATIEEKEAGNFLQRILAAVRQDNFSLSEFLALLNEIKSEKAAILNNQVYPEKETFTKLERGKPKVLKTIETNIKRSPGISKSEMKLLIPGSRQKETQLAPEKKAESKQTNNENALKGSNTILIAALLQVLVIIGVILVAGYLKQITQDTIAAYGGTGIILFSIDFMLLRKLFERDNKASETDNNDASSKKPAKSSEHVNSKLNMSKREIRNDTVKSVDKDGDFTFKEPADKSIQPYTVDFPVGSQMYSQSISDETALLDINMLKYPQLQRRSDGMLESINITKQNFIIGRLKDQADHVLENNSVGKLHAEIILRDGEYFLIDLNSRNGTYINGVRIPSNIEQAINSNDRITFANAEFTFVLPVK